MQYITYIVYIAYIADSHYTSYWALIETDAYSETCQTSKMERFAKIIVPFNYFCIYNIYSMNIGSGINTTVNFKWL